MKHKLEIVCHHPLGRMLLLSSSLGVPEVYFPHLQEILNIYSKYSK